MMKSQETQLFCSNESGTRAQGAHPSSKARRSPRIYLGHTVSYCNIMYYNTFDTLQILYGLSYLQQHSKSSYMTSYDNTISFVKQCVDF